MLIAVDFDGVIVESAYPDISEEIQGAFETLKKWKSLGDILILYTCRANNELYRAIIFCEQHGLTFDLVNENHPFLIRSFGETRKISADWYIDDKAMSRIIDWDMLSKQREEMRNHPEQPESLMTAASKYVNRHLAKIAHNNV